MPVMMTTDMSATANNDADLVVASLSGDRDAFGQIVSRYQSLICSLAYSATGSLGASEDLAQETFITAWKHLRHLREQNKLRAWLCGIARNRINSALRREGREPVRAAAPLEEIHDSASAEPLPPDHTISKEEEAILWRSLERVPEIYREPLVLFYREHQSIENVAGALDLSEDAVKQRLSRGRKLLAEEVAAFVEGALARTNPGKAFTVGVVAALSGISISAQAAAVGVSAAKGGAAAKSVGVAGALAALFSPVLIVFGNYLGYRIGLDEAESEMERRLIKNFYRRVLLATGLLTVALAVGLAWQQQFPFTVAEYLILVGFGALVCYLPVMLVGTLFNAARRRAHYAKKLADVHGGVLPKPVYEFRTRAALFGLPLIHIRMGDRFDMLQKPVKAWIAVGNQAVGGLLAFGGMAVAPVAMGFCGIGLISFSGLAVGVIALGGLAWGGWTYGGLAMGWQAMGCFALALHAAVGNIAVGYDFAMGHLVLAPNANTIAPQAVMSDWFWKGGTFLQHYSLWVNLLWIAPLFIMWRLVAKQKAAATLPK